jgi:transposase
MFVLVIDTYINLSKEDLIEEVVNLKSTITLLKTELDQIKRLIYGSRSERFQPEVNPEQTALALDIITIEPKPKEKETITYEREKKSSSQTIHTGRNPLPAHLPRVEIIIEPSEDVSGMKKIGKEITEQLEFDPGKFFVKQFIRPKYAKPDGEGVIIAALPSRPIEKGIPGAGLLANITIEKYADHLPLYRQIERFKRAGITIAPSTMSDWNASGAELITPLFNVLKKVVLRCHYLQADETPIKVLDREKKGKTHRGYYWVYRDVVNGLVLFDYREGRGRDGPTDMLKDFEGYLQTDGYGVYDSFDTKKIKLLHCMAHARRYFEQALDNNRELAEYALKEMQKLYVIEKHARENELTYQERYELRRKESVPVLKGLHSWLKNSIIEVPPKSSIGQAIAYALPRWEKLMLYTTDGKLEIDNNLVENSIRPIAIGRKNYLFAGSHASAQRAAMIYSLIGTCKLKSVEPFAWLKNIFEVIPDYKANRLEELLP